MGNIKNFNFNKLDLRLSNSDYWDFFINSDEYNDCDISSDYSCDPAVNFDFSNINTFENFKFGHPEKIISLNHWNGSKNKGVSLDTFGLTGVDNGSVIFNKFSGDTFNEGLLNALTGSTLILDEGDFKMRMTTVTGTTEEFVYPLEGFIDLNDNIPHINFCGGFFQGFYKLDGYDYEVLPTRTELGWTSEFVLRPSNLNCNVSGKTLNDVFPNNKGFFFFTGARAENKFWNVFTGASSGCTSGCTVSSGCTSNLNKWCTLPKETDMSFIDNKNMMIPLSPVDYEYELVTNPFLIYGGSKCDVPDLKYTATTAGFLIDEFGNYIISEKSEKILIEDTTVFKIADNTNSLIKDSLYSCSPCKTNCSGLGTQTACSYDGNGIMIKKKKRKKTNFQNPFLIYGRASKNSCNCCSCTGESDGLGTETVCSFSGFTSDVVELDNKADVIGNALGFRVKDDGSIGYRLLTYTGNCETDINGVTTYTSGATIEEGYSISGIVQSNSWSHIVVKFITCSPLTGINGGPLTDCDLNSARGRKGRLSFYVNGKLVYWVDEFDEFIARRLNEHRDKQIGVPFNFSLGGGSQGLLESQTFDGIDLQDRGLLIEQNFAGTFIGDIRKFKYYLCGLSYSQIQNNHKLAMNSAPTTNQAPSGYYYGKSLNNALNLNVISGLTFTLGNTAINFSFNIPSLINGYIYILIPITFKQPTEFRNSNEGCKGFIIPMLSLGTIIIPDVNGFNVEYNVYRSFNKTASALDVWLCD